MKYWKFDKAMQKAGIEYNLEEKDALILVETAPENNNIAQENINSVLKKDEVCVNSSPGKFSIIQKDVKVYKKEKESES